MLLCVYSFDNLLRQRQGCILFLTITKKSRTKNEISPIRNSQFIFNFNLFFKIILIGEQY